MQTFRSHSFDFNNPPTKTYWPFINPGPQEYNISYNGATGPWSSERNHLVVVVTKPSFMSDNDFYRLLNGEFRKQMDLLLPAYVTFDWAIDNSYQTAFVLGTSRLDFDSITSS